MSIQSDLERLQEYYRPLVRERAEQIRSEGGRLSHHLVWFPLVDQYEVKEGEQVAFRMIHKDAAREIFLEWCRENEVTPASYWGEFGHNLIGFSRLLLAVGGAALFYLAVGRLAEDTGQAIVLAVLGGVSWWGAWQVFMLHVRYQQTVMKKKHGPGDQDRLFDDVNKHF